MSSRRVNSVCLPGTYVHCTRTSCGPAHGAYYGPDAGGPSVGLIWTSCGPLFLRWPYCRRDMGPKRAYLRYHEPHCRPDAASHCSALGLLLANYVPQDEAGGTERGKGVGGVGLGGVGLKEARGWARGKGLGGGARGDRGEVVVGWAGWGGVGRSRHQEHQERQDHMSTKSIKHINSKHS